MSKSELLTIGICTIEYYTWLLLRVKNFPGIHYAFAGILKLEITPDAVQHLQEKDNKRRKTLHATAAPKIWIGQSEFNRREKLYYPRFNVSEQEKHLSPETASNIQEKAYKIQKPYQIVKIEKYEIFWASKILIWRQRQATRSQFVEYRQVG